MLVQVLKWAVTDVLSLKSPVDRYAEMYREKLIHESGHALIKLADPDRSVAIYMNASDLVNFALSPSIKLPAAQVVSSQSEKYSWQDLVDPEKRGTEVDRARREMMITYLAGMAAQEATGQEKSGHFQEKSRIRDEDTNVNGTVDQWSDVQVPLRLAHMILRGKDLPIEELRGTLRVHKKEHTMLCDQYVQTIYDMLVVFFKKHQDLLRMIERLGPVPSVELRKAYQEHPGRTDFFTGLSQLFVDAAVCAAEIKMKLSSMEQTSPDHVYRNIGFPVPAPDYREILYSETLPKFFTYGATSTAASLVSQGIANNFPAMATNFIVSHLPALTVLAFGVLMAKSKKAA